MISLVWTAFGMALSAAMLHTVLGLRRPIHVTYLSLACMMAWLAVFLYLQVDFYRVPTSQAVVETVRRQVTAAHCVIGCFLVFIPAYTGVRVPRLLMATCFGVLAIFVLTNLGSAYGLWYSASPERVRMSFAGDEYLAVVPPPMTLPQYAYELYYFGLMIIAFVCAVKMFRRGQRQRGAILAFAVAIVFGLAIVDLVRDAIGASWPYFAAFGITTFGLVMSIQLAHEFRVQADELATMIVHAEEQKRRQECILDALRALQHDVHAPARELEIGVNALTPATPTEQSNIGRLQRAVSRLRDAAPGT